jgi:CRP/FNR family cyclic AMP-dependent transcriptional regulator
MARSFLSRPTQDDPLTYLPRKPLQEFAKGRVIYDHQQPNHYLYVVILGRVKVITTSDDGGQTVGRIVCPDGLFGESCLVTSNPRRESAVALDNATLMAWSRAEIEQQIEREPRLGLALSQFLVRQCMELQERIESMAVYKTPVRVLLALVQLSEDLGSPTADGSIRIASLTHNVLSEYVGTSREIVTFQMNRLRRLGVLRYTRKYIDVSPQALQEVLRQEGIQRPYSPVAMHASDGYAV